MPCIALYPVGNATSTWQFWNLRSKRYIRHSTWVRMHSSELITDVINNIAEEEQGRSDDNEQVVQEIVTEEPVISAEEGIVENTNNKEEKVKEDSNGKPAESPVGEPIPDTSGQAVRRSARIAAGVQPPERYVHASFVEKSRWVEGKAKDAIRAEVNQLFKELEALRPVRAELIAVGACILTCHMFLVEKFLADGSFDKTKARLVSHGNKQDKDEFLDRSLPTVAIQSVMMALELFAGNMENHTVCKIDMKGAFVQTPMEGEPIYLRIGRDIVKQIVEQFPEYQEFVTEDG